MNLFCNEFGHHPRAKAAGQSAPGRQMARLALVYAVSVACQGRAEPLRVPPSLIAQGIPPIPASLAADVAPYTDENDVDLLDLDPAGRRVLVATEVGNTAQVFQMLAPGGKLTQLTFFADKPTHDVAFNPATGRDFIFSKDLGGDQNFQIYRYDFSTAKPVLLTDGKSKNDPSIWSPDGARIAYGSTRRNGADVDLYVMDPSKPSTDRMVTKLDGGGWAPLDWSPDGRAIVAVDHISATDEYLWEIDAASGAKKLLTPKIAGKSASFDGAQYSRDGKGLYVLTDLGSEFKRLAYFEPATSRYTYLTSHIPWDIEEFQLSPDGKLIGLVANENGLLVLHLLNATTGAEIRLDKVPPGYVIGLHWSGDSRYLGFSLDSVRSPSDAYVLDTATLDVARWTHSGSNSANTGGLSEPQLIHWRGFDGLALSGFLYRPPASFSGRRPVIIDIHGGPEEQFQPFYQGIDNYYTTGLGIAVVHPNIRGSIGYGKSFEKLDDGYRREDSYRDIGALLDWIRAQPDLDAGRVMTMGVSYGGHMSLAVAARYSERIRCAIDIVGPANLVTFLEHTASYRQDLRRVEYGDERDPKMRAFLERIAPLTNAGRIVKPLFVVQGKNDPIVPVSESASMVAAVRRNGTPVWYLEANDEGHGFFKKSNRDYQFYATVAFIRKYLLD